MRETYKIRNYRPVTVLNGMSKIYGRRIHNNLSCYAETILVIDIKLVLYKSCTVFTRSSPSFFELIYTILFCKIIV